jgi:hypothetical protein
MRNKRGKDKKQLELSRRDTGLVIKALMNLSNELADSLSKQAGELKDKEYLDESELLELTICSSNIYRTNELIIIFADHLPESEIKTTAVAVARDNIQFHKLGLDILVNTISFRRDETHKWN